jgi:hypothetical protein
MRTLKESLLADIDNSLEQGDKDIKHYNCFGRVFKLRRTVLSRTGVSAFSATGLKKLNKNLDYINDTTAMDENSYMYVGTGKKAKMFCNWVDHIKLDELDLSASDLKILSKGFNDNLRAKIIKNFTELCRKNDVFNTPELINVRLSYVHQPVNSELKNELEIIIWHRKGDRRMISAGSMIKFVYEINI